MKIRHQETNCNTGEVRVWEEDVPDDGSVYLSEAQAAAIDAKAAIDDWNAGIKARLAENDAKIVRAAVEAMHALAQSGTNVLNADRIAEHVQTQAELRAQFKS